jgi:hypothetical protein
MEVGNWQSTKSLYDGVLTSTEKRLILFIVKAEVANHHDGLMEELLTVLLFIRSLHCIMEYIVEEVI